MKNNLLNNKLVSFIQKIDTFFVRYENFIDELPPYVKDQLKENTGILTEDEKKDIANKILEANLFNYLKKIKEDSSNIQALLQRNKQANDAEEDKENEYKSLEKMNLSMEAEKEELRRKQLQIFYDFFNEIEKLKNILIEQTELLLSLQIRRVEIIHSIKTLITDFGSELSEGKVKVDGLNDEENRLLGKALIGVVPKIKDQSCAEIQNIMHKEIKNGLKDSTKEKQDIAIQAVDKKFKQNYREYKANEREEKEVRKKIIDSKYTAGKNRRQLIKSVAEKFISQEPTNHTLQSPFVGKDRSYASTAPSAPRARRPNLFDTSGLDKPKENDEPDKPKFRP
jgi:hypothetical protein